jgi:putative spermidine/putrescine transport system substrate-binding protein
VPKGAKDKAAAMQFIAFATSAAPQAEMAAITGYAPINLDSTKLMDPATAKTLPDQQKASQINADMAYWAAHRDAIGERWYAWQAK